MYACEADTLVLLMCVPERLTEFQMLSSGLENCQKSLNDYLDSKRRVFSRYINELSLVRPVRIFRIVDGRSLKDSLTITRRICVTTLIFLFILVILSKQSVSAVVCRYFWS